MEIKVSEIKEEGRASLAYAYDINNVYTAGGCKKSCVYGK